VKSLLIDENLPFQLGVALGVDYLHASRVSEQASDSEIWKVAKASDFTILTKDTDFFNTLLQQGTPPKVIWIRMGNLRKHDLIEKIKARWIKIQELSETHDLVQVFSDRIETMNFPRVS
jgi:predicted nuclease of predicted toxin-antitoxin system